MNKFYLFLAFAAFAVFACSDDKKDPTHEELCKTLKKECLEGIWDLRGVYEPSDLDNESDCTGTGTLKLESNGEFSYSGDYNRENDVGQWSLNGNSINVDNTELGLKTGTVSINGSGSEMTIKSDEQYAVFSDCRTRNQPKVEKFRWRSAK